VEAGAFASAFEAAKAASIIAQAATKHGLEPRTIGFKGTIQTLEAFQPVITMQGRHDAAFREHLYQHLLDAVVAHLSLIGPIASSPDDENGTLRNIFTFIKPRYEAKRDMANGVREQVSSIRPTHRSHFGR
jgi:hypothetical protein